MWLTQRGFFLLSEKNCVGSSSCTRAAVNIKQLLCIRAKRDKWHSMVAFCVMLFMLVLGRDKRENAPVAPSELCN